MALNSGELNYAGNGQVYVAPVGTAMPTTEAAALNALFVGLGYHTEDGATISPAVDVSEVRAWQSPYAIDRRITSRDFTISFSLMQINKLSWQLTFGGGTWSTTTGTHTYVPPSPEVVDYRAIVLEMVDGADITRILVPKALVSEPGAVQIQRSEPSTIDLTLAMVTTGSGDPWNVVSNRAEFATP